MIFRFPRKKKLRDFDRFRSCHFRDTNVTKMSQTCHENNRSENDEFSFFMEIREIHRYRSC